jgi:quinol monooxygenase YgiN
MNKITVEDVLTDLATLGEQTSTGQYGYDWNYGSEDTHDCLLVEVWNDSYHGTKALYQVKVELERIW